LVEEIEAAEVHQHAGVALGQQRDIERLATGAGVVEAHLVAQDRFARAGPALDNGDPAWDETAGQDRVETLYAAGYSV